MAISKIEDLELTFFLDRLTGIIDFNKDLPMKVFTSGGLSFWFFERPLLCYVDVCVGLILKSVCSFKSDVFIKFSGGEALEKSCFSVDGSDLERDVFWLNKRFESFFDGAVGYPIILCDSACDWIVFESAYEEFGVIAVRDSALNEEFNEYLNLNFISKDTLAELAAGSSVEGKTAKALMSSYCS
ncbi:hypothetical protein RJC98_26670 [Pseudomonas allii]|uniref:Uncharacterized protein n=1 Tax=Pseudomonas allii TaxID=2740531 RepID=A0ACC6LKJ5_9PSED|nr:hypothetical protein [Pseudomonas allii]MDR9878783.1 hypothetical protein [Pseudomonas allii]